MASSTQPRVRYVTRYCALLQQDVEVVLVQRADGRWFLAHCREQSRQCNGHECPPHAQEGPLPFEVTWW